MLDFHIFGNTISVALERENYHGKGSFVEQQRKTASYHELEAGFGAFDKR